MLKLLIVLLIIAIATPVLAQTDTPTPLPTATPQNTLTPFPTYAFPTLTPNGLATRIWATPPMPSEGNPFVAPAIPALNDTTESDVTGFVAINDLNIGALIVYLVEVGMAFWAWMRANIPQVIRAARWLIIINMVIYMIFMIWKGYKYAPPGSDGKGFRIRMSRRGRQ